MRQQNLFQGRAEEDLKKRAPLAERLRPKTIDEFVGQRRLLGPGKILDRLLRSESQHSIILWGPPGCGKTTLANIIAAHSGNHLVSLSAVMAGTKEIRAAVDEALEVWVRTKKRTWLFMDEVHRLNKAQQDTLLPHVENGRLLFLGATTENPSFEVIRPLLSRTQVLVLEPLDEEDLRTIIARALKDEERGLGKHRAKLTREAEEHLLAACGGDARVMLSALEVAVLTTPPSADGGREICARDVAEALQRPAVHYDKAGEEHFNLISAFHKSIRGSDPDAALYWLSRMLEGGEDPLYLARRMVRMASEDVGLADPFALIEAVNALRSYEFLGSPEGDLALAQAAVYLALAPKSDSVYKAFKAARELAGKTGSSKVPLHLRNAPTGLMKKLGYGRDYRYPHDDPSGWVPEDYLPEPLAGTVFYSPCPRGWEAGWKDLLEERRRKSAKAAGRSEDRKPEGGA